MDTASLNAKEEIYSFPAHMDFFKNNDIASACYKLTCCVEKLFLQFASPYMMLNHPGEVGYLQDEARSGYRAAIKWAFSFCSGRDKAFLPNHSPGDMQKCNDIIMLGADFANIRNMFDRVDIGRIGVSVKDREVVFEPFTTVRDYNAEIYARSIGQMSEYRIKKTDEFDNKTFVHMVHPLRKGHWNDFSKIPLDKRLFLEIIGDCFQKIRVDNEEIVDVDFGEFTLDDFEKVYAVLMALGIMNFNHHLVNEDLSSPVIFSEKTSLVRLISEYSKVKTKAIKSIIELLTYDYEFQKNNVTTYQPLFYFGKFVFYSPSLLYFSEACSKLFYLVKEKDIKPEAISKIAKQRESVMVDRLVDFISENSALKCVSNYKLNRNGRTLAEFDLLIYDSKNNVLLLAELKHFFDTDGEKGWKRLDNRIGDAIESRRIKQRLAEENIDALIFDAFGISVISKPNVASCIVSQNYSGSSYVDDKLAIFDELLFTSTMHTHKFDLGVIVSKMEDGTYIPDMKAYCYNKTVEYAGYRVTYPGFALRI